MMKSTTAAKIQNLRDLLSKTPFNGLPYADLEALVIGDPDLPSTSTLRRYDLLKVVRTEYYAEWYTTEQVVADDFDITKLMALLWDEPRGKWVFVWRANWYGVA